MAKMAGARAEFAIQKVLSMFHRRKALNVYPTNPLCRIIPAYRFLAKKKMGTKEIKIRGRKIEGGNPTERRNPDEVDNKQYGKSSPKEFFRNATTPITHDPNPKKRNN